MRETLGAIAGAVLAYAACAYALGGTDPATWAQIDRLGCVVLMLIWAMWGGLFASAARAG